MSMSAEHMSKFAAPHRQWRCLHMNEKFSSEMKNHQKNARNKTSSLKWHGKFGRVSLSHTFYVLLVERFWFISHVLKKMRYNKGWTLTFQSTECGWLMATKWWRIRWILSRISVIIQSMSDTSHCQCQCQWPFFW